MARSSVRIWVAAAATLAIVCGCGLTGGNDEPAAAPEFVSEAVPPSEAGPAFEPLPESPAPEPSSEPSPSKTSKKPAKPKAAPEKTEPVFWSELPACARRD